MNSSIAQILARIAAGDIEVEGEPSLYFSTDGFLAGEYGQAIPLNSIIVR